VSVVHALIIGIVQGLTEFLPVSSSGHMTIAEMLLGMDDASEMLAFDVAMHAATLLAILVFFARSWVRAITAQPQLLLVVSAACVPAVALYFAFASAIALAKTSLLAVGLAFGVTAAALVAADRLAMGVSSPGFDLQEARGQVCDRLWRALVVGAAQAVALFPGVSRSGATISAALFCRSSRESAFAFSFLVGAPLMFGAILIEARDISGLVATNAWPVVSGGLAAFAAGLLGLLILRRVVTSGRLWLFGAYAGVLSLVCLVVSLVRAVASNGGAA